MPDHIGSCTRGLSMGVIDPAMRRITTSNVQPPKWQPLLTWWVKRVDRLCVVFLKIDEMSLWFYTVSLLKRFDALLVFDIFV